MDIGLERQGGHTTVKVKVNFSTEYLTPLEAEHKIVELRAAIDRARSENRPGTKIGDY